MKVMGDLVNEQGQMKLFEFDLKDGEKVVIEKLYQSIKEQVPGYQISTWWVDK